MSQGSLEPSALAITDICTQCGSAISSLAPSCAHDGKLPSKLGKIVKARRKTYRLRKTPEMLFSKKVRLELKASMLALVPGVSRAMAEAVLAAYEGSMAGVVGASSMELSRVKSGNGSPIGQELGVAIFRALH